MKLKTRVRSFFNWKRMIWDSYCNSRIKLTQRIKYAIKGFSWDDYKAYGFPNNNSDDYISLWDVHKTDKINDPFTPILQDKIIFEEVVGKYVLVPQNYAIIKNGMITGLNGYYITNENLKDFIEEKGSVFIKVVNGSKGIGAHRIDIRNHKIIIDNHETDEDEMWSILKQENQYLMSETVKQSNFSEMLYPNSINSIRVICAKNRGENTAHIIAAAQRFGTDYSIPTDNISAGGMSSVINLETGELAAAVARVGEKENIYKMHVVHPDTGEQIKGKVIPEWSKIRDELEKLTTDFLYLNFVAWDIVLLPEGKYCILEGNRDSGVTMFQMKQGARGTLLWDWYEGWGLLNK